MRSVPGMTSYNADRPLQITKRLWKCPGRIHPVLGFDKRLKERDSTSDIQGVSSFSIQFWRSPDFWRSIIFCHRTKVYQINLLSRSLSVGLLFTFIIVKSLKGVIGPLEGLLYEVSSLGSNYLSPEIIEHNTCNICPELRRLLKK